MANLNGIQIFVESEDLKRAVDVTSHAVESGIDITDHVKPKARTLSISGEIVGANSANNQSKIYAMMNAGTLVSYSGRNTIKNAQIVSFDTSHPYTIWGGCSFTMELQEVRIAQNSYKPKNAKTGAKQKSGTQQTQKNNKQTAVYHTVKKGETVWGLVAASNAPYRSYGKTCAWVIDNNPQAFSKKGDARTLKIGAKLLVGYKTA